MGAVMARGADTRTRILDIAEAAVLEKGFEATSIDEIVAASAISRGGFFYHFQDKNALARAMLERYIAAEDKLYDELFARARELNDDPLHSILIGLKMLAELLNDMPNGHPGCVIAAATYQDRLFDEGVRDLNRQAILGWRKRFRAMFEEIASVYEPRDPGLGFSFSSTLAKRVSANFRNRRPRTGREYSDGRSPELARN